MGIDSKQFYPRILIVNGEPINSMTATGITLNNLFRNWPKESLAQIYTQPIPYDDVCIFSRRITLMDLKLPFRLKSWIMAQTHEHNDRNSGRQTCLKADANKVANVKNLNVKGNFRGDIYTLLNLAPFKLPANLIESCQEFNPDIIYSMLGGLVVMKLAQHLSRVLKVPIVPHFVDDWPSTNRYKYPFGPLFILVQTVLFRSIIRNSPVFLTICDEMSKVYKTRYKKYVYAFMNCIETIAELNSLSRQETSCIRFGYIGGLHLNRWQSLKDVGDALQTMKNEGLDVELVVYAPPLDIEKYGPILRANPVVNMDGTLPVDKVIPSLQHFDVLIHIESFDERDRLYTRLSISTKIPEYMSSGRPILAYGPSDVASCRHIEENGCGLVVGSQNKELLSRELRKLASDRNLRERLGLKGREVALKKHNAENERERFREVLGKVAGCG